MLKRLLAASLWFYAGWYLGAMIAFHLGLHSVLGPILGLAAGALVAIDPRRIIWTARAEAAATESGTTPAPRRRRIADPA